MTKETSEDNAKVQKERGSHFFTSVLGLIVQSIDQAAALKMMAGGANADAPFYPVTTRKRARNYDGRMAEKEKDAETWRWMKSQ